MTNKRRLPVLLLMLGLSVAAAAAQDKPFDLATRVALDIPTQRLESALLELSKQAAFQLVISAGTLPDRDIAALSGTMPIREALERLLRGTDLGYRWVGEHTVTVAPRGKLPARTGAAAGRMNAIQLAQAGVVDSARVEGAPEPSAAGQQQEAVEEGAEVLVTGSRIRGTPGGSGINPVITITRKDIERSGVASLGELRRFIPQIPAGLSFAQEGSRGGTGFNGGDQGALDYRTSLSLRGLGNNSTLVLVNGRRISKSGQYLGSDDYDLSGIPLSAIERIEILTDGASAVYGADAIAGVVNVILRKDYKGAELDVSYDNTFDSDAAVKTLALTAGYGHGKFSAMLSATWQEANALSATDRYFTASNDHRPLGGRDVRGGMPVGAGLVWSLTGLPLPGLDSDTATIPAGQDGRNLTIDDYRTAVETDYYDEALITELINPYRRRNLTVSADYAFAGWLKAFGEARWNETVNYTFVPSPGAYGDIIVPAGYPGNPFGEDIALIKYFWELGNEGNVSTLRNPQLAFGFRGGLPGRWAYETTANWAASRPTTDLLFGFGFDAALVDAAINDPDPARRPILLHDGRIGAANPPGLLEALIPDGALDEESDTYSYDLKVDGPLFSLPAGAVKVAAGVEYRDERYDLIIAPGSFYDNPLYRDNWPQGPLGRTVFATFAEALVPLVNPKQDIPLLRRLDLQLAARRDEYSDFTGPVSPRYGFRYEPFEGLALRASRSDGFKVPLLRQMYSAVRTSAVNYNRPPLAGLRDPSRGNELIAGTITETRGGVPGLEPEESTSTNLGAVFSPPVAKGLTLTLDYYELEYFNRIGTPTREETIGFFPERLTRAAPSDGFPVGRITGFDFRYGNLDRLTTTGYDLGLTYDRETAHGQFSFKAVGTKVLEYELRAGPLTAPRDTTESRPVRISGSAFWTRGPWETGISGSFQDSMRFVYSQQEIRPHTEWDLHFSYDPERAGPGRAAQGAGGWSWLLADTRLSLSIVNLFDHRPPPMDGEADFAVADPRMRRLVLGARKKF